MFVVKNVANGQYIVNTTSKFADLTDRRLAKVYPTKSGAVSSAKYHQKVFGYHYEIRRSLYENSPTNNPPPGLKPDYQVFPLEPNTPPDVTYNQTFLYFGEPWHADEDDNAVRIFKGELQIIKAPKHSEIFAEYFPEPDMIRWILDALNKQAKEDLQRQ